MLLKTPGFFDLSKNFNAFCPFSSICQTITSSLRRFFNTKEKSACKLYCKSGAMSALALNDLSRAVKASSKFLRCMDEADNNPVFDTISFIIEMREVISGYLSLIIFSRAIKFSSNVDASLRKTAKNSAFMI